MTLRSERALTLACVADQSPTAAALYEALVAMFPAAVVTRMDTSAERVLPESVDCAVIGTTVNGVDGLDVLRQLRARGFAGAAVLLLDPARELSTADAASTARLGARTCAIESGAFTSVAAAVADAVSVQEGRDEASAADAVRALRQTQRLIAAGEMAMRLQHSLNNPLAALLAEAQLLELEQLSDDHRSSVERIIELARRVVEVVRGLDGVGRA